MTFFPFPCLIWAGFQNKILQIPRCVMRKIDVSKPGVEPNHHSNTSKEFFKIPVAVGRFFHALHNVWSAKFFLFLNLRIINCTDRSFSARW